MTEGFLELCCFYSGCLGSDHRQNDMIHDIHQDHLIWYAWGKKNVIGSLYIPLLVFLGFVLNACRRNKSLLHSAIPAMLMKEPLTPWQGISVWCCCEYAVVCLQSAQWCCSYPLPALHWSRSAGRIVGKLISPSATHTSQQHSKAAFITSLIHSYSVFWPQSWLLCLIWFIYS